MQEAQKQFIKNRITLGVYNKYKQPTANWENVFSNGKETLKRIFSIKDRAYIYLPNVGK